MRMVGSPTPRKEAGVTAFASRFVSQGRSSINLELLPHQLENGDVRVTANIRGGLTGRRLISVFTETYRPGNYLPEIGDVPGRTRVEREAVQAVRDAEVAHTLFFAPNDPDLPVAVIAAVSDFERAVTERRGRGFTVGKVRMLTGMDGKSGILLSPDQRSTIAAVVPERMRRITT